MKKLFLLSALALGAMMMSAQLTLQCKINDAADISTLIGGGSDDTYESLPIQYLCQYTSTDGAIQERTYSIKLFDVNDGSVYKTIELGKYDLVLYASKNFWTTDGKVTFLAEIFQDRPYTLVLMDEDGNILQNITTRSVSVPLIFKTTAGYKLIFIEEDDQGNDYTYIYAIPGNGQPTNLEAPTAPVRTSSAHKVVENGQMYIILDGVKYAVTGSQAE